MIKWLKKKINLHNNKATYIKAGTTLKETIKTIRTVNEDCKFFCLLKE